MAGVSIHPPDQQFGHQANTRSWDALPSSRSIAKCEILDIPEALEGFWVGLTLRLRVGDGWGLPALHNAAIPFSIRAMGSWMFLYSSPSN